MTKIKSSRKRRGASAKRGRERVFDGLAVSRGIAIGTAHVSESGAIDVPEYSIARAKVAAERARFAKSVEASRKQVAKLKAKAAVEEVGYLLDAYLQMLWSRNHRRSLRGDRRVGAAG